MDAAGCVGLPTFRLLVAKVTSAFIPSDVLLSEIPRMAIVPHDLEEFDRELPQVELLTTKGSAPIKRGRKAAQIVAKFLFGQGAAQTATILANLLLVHTLSTEAYAQFSLATAFQTVFTVLMDLGFASTIVPMVGQNREDAALLGRYVRSARHLRTILFWILSPIAAVGFLVIANRHHWTPGIQILLLASILVSLYYAGKVSYLSAPLFIFGRLKEYYLPQVITGTGRLLSYIVLSLAKGLNAWTAAGLGAMNIVLNGFLIQKTSKKYFEWPKHESPETDRELIQYILPATPAIIFSAFQSQISLFLISIFGGTSYIAEVAALSRIGQMFLIAITFYTIVVEPYTARQSFDRLKRVFLEFILIATAAFIPLILLSFFWPKPFLWILGAKYQGVEGVMGPYILSACINSIAALVWIMNRARKWVFWSGSVLEIALLMAVQITFLIGIGVRTTHQAVLFNLVSSLCYLVAHAYVTVLGFTKTSREQRVAPGRTA
jgi:O-antigen/teichoic acid export membrane protein